MGTAMFFGQWDWRASAVPLPERRQNGVALLGLGEKSNRTALAKHWLWLTPKEQNPPSNDLGAGPNGGA